MIRLLLIVLLLTFCTTATTVAQTVQIRAGVTETYDLATGDTLQVLGDSALVRHVRADSVIYWIGTQRYALPVEIERTPTPLGEILAAIAIAQAWRRVWDE